ncbi:hypothetical protein H0E87_028723 [Populus deltoides]|uniref:Pentatricopeptide repeat-containing protein n=1 Tax=Populus deltoides TaxID=3696 RepID=A0A8T2WTX6_POPDE|nr:hypothetical protein H0E87_028723 [Populus deltoides]
MPHKDTVTLDTMITAYVDSGYLRAAWDFLKSMKRRGFQADGYTFGSIRASRYDLGQKVHSLIVKIGYERNVYAGSALLDMYAECDRVEDAYDVFRGMPTRNFVSWNALLDGFVQECGPLEDAETVFDGAVGTRDSVTWNSMLAAYVVHDKDE